MPVARRDEIETQRSVGRFGAFVRVPVEAGGVFGVAGGFELGYGWELGMVSGRVKVEGLEVDVMRRTVGEHDLFDFGEGAGVGGAGFDVPILVIGGVIVCELTEVLEAAELGEGVEVDIARLRVGRRVGKDGGREGESKGKDESEFHGCLD